MGFIEKFFNGKKYNLSREEENELKELEKTAYLEEMRRKARYKGIKEARDEE